MNNRLTQDEAKLIERWRELSLSYAAVPGRERWDEYTSFLYHAETALLAIVDRLASTGADQ